MSTIPGSVRRGAATAMPLSPRHAARSTATGVRRSGLTLAGAGFVVYLWVIHSAKAPLGAAAIVVGLVGLLMQRESLRIPAPLIWFGAFVIWGGIGYFTAEFPAITSQNTWDYVKIWLIFLLALNLVHTRVQLRWMMIAWMGIFALYPIRGIFLNFIQGIQTDGRYAWNLFFGNPNDFATLTLPILAMSVAMLQFEKQRWVRYCALAGVILLPLAIMLTQSRGGILALFTFAALVLIQYRRRVGTLVLTVMILFAVIQLAPQAVWSRLGNLRYLASESTISAADTVGSAQQRYDIWRVARAIARDHPVMGVGVGGYAPTHAEYAATGKYPGWVGGKRDAHSTYLHTAAETGFPGLFLFAGLIVVTFYSGWRGASRIKPGDPHTAQAIRTLLFGLVAFLQACVFASMEHLPFLYIYIAIISTMVALNAPAAAKAAVPAARRRRG